MSQLGHRAPWQGFFFKRPRELIKQWKIEARIKDIPDYPDIVASERDNGTEEELPQMQFPLEKMGPAMNPNFSMIEKMEDASGLERTK